MGICPMANVGIRNSWPLVDFAKSHGQMKVTNELTNSQTGETFKSCAFIGAEGAVTLVSFSTNLNSIDTSAGPKTISRQIAAQKDDLQVVELDSGNFKLCKRGTDSWADVDLGL